MGDEVRVFFAIELGDAAHEAAAQVLRELRRAPGADAVRWVRPEAMHVTLRFIGEVASQRLAPLVREVAVEVAGTAGFELGLGAACLFPSPRRPRVVALELGPRDRLAELAASVERGVVAAGLEPEERPFRAHLTLGRLRRGRPPRTEGLGAPRGTVSPVSEIVLFRSELAPSGAQYTALERLSLGR